MTQRQTISRLIHGDNLKNWPKESREQFEEPIKLHIGRCKHPKCMKVKENWLINSFHVVKCLILVEKDALY